MPRADRLVAIWYNGFASHDPATGKQIDRRSSDYEYWLAHVMTAEGGRLFAKIVNRPEFVELDPEDLIRIRDRTIAVNKWNDPIAVSRDGKTVAVAFGNSVRLLDAKTGKSLHPDVDAYPTCAVTSIQFSADGHRMLTAGYHSVRVWNAMTGKPIAAINQDDGHLDDPFLTRDGRWVVGVDGAAHDYPLVIWNAETGKEVFRQSAPPLGQRRGQRMIGVDPNGRAWVNAGKIICFEVPSGQVVHEIRGFDECISAQLSPDGKRLAVAGWKAFAIRDTNPTAEWHVIAEYPGRHKGGCAFDEPPCPVPVTFSPNGNLLFTKRGYWSRNTRALEAWDVTGKPKVIGSRVLSPWFIFTPDGRQVISPILSANDKARVFEVYEVATERKAFQFDAGGEVTALAFSPGGTRLVIAYADTTLEVRDWMAIVNDAARK